MIPLLVLDKNAAFYADAIQASCPAYAVHAAATAEDARAAAADAEVLCALAPDIPADLVRAMPQLRWIHALTSGVDNLLAMDLPAGVALTRSRGFHGPQMSELAFLMMLALARRFPTMLENQRNARWARWPQPLLAGGTLCIVGLGAIAEALAARASAFGMRVTGVSDGRTRVEGFARVFPRAAIREAAAEADFLVVVVPYGPGTHHLVDGAVLDALKPGGFLVNIARGGCVDEAAVAARLADGRLAGAALDVFDQEPLAADSPLWHLPNLIVTPHIGGMSEGYHRQVLPILLDALETYARHGPAGLEDPVMIPTGDDVR